MRKPIAPKKPFPPYEEKKIVKEWDSDKSESLSLAEVIRHFEGYDFNKVELLVSQDNYDFDYIGCDVKFVVYSDEFTESYLRQKESYENKLSLYEERYKVYEEKMVAYEAWRKTTKTYQREERERMGYESLINSHGLIKRQL